MNWEELRRKILPRVFKGTITGIEYKCEGPIHDPKARVSLLYISIRSKKDPNFVLRYPMGRIEFLHRIYRRGLATGDSVTVFSPPFKRHFHLLRHRRKAEMSVQDKTSITRLLDRAACELDYMIREKERNGSCSYSLRELQHFQVRSEISKIDYR